MSARPAVPMKRPVWTVRMSALTVDTALRLERYFGWPAHVWLNLQSHHDQQTAKESLKATLAGIRPCAALSKSTPRSRYEKAIRNGDSVHFTTF